MLVYGGDVANYTAPFDPNQLAWINANWDFGIIGLQFQGVAIAFQAQLERQRRGYYLDLPGRDLGIPERGSPAWIDVEPGCFQSIADIDRAVNAALQKNLVPGIYGNPTSLLPVIGNSTRYASLPLWWPNFGTPDLTRFLPFNGWTKATVMQYSSAGVGLIAPTGLRAQLRAAHQAFLTQHPQAPAMGALAFAPINCDLDVMAQPAPIATEDITTMTWAVLKDPPPGAPGYSYILMPGPGLNSYHVASVEEYLALQEAGGVAGITGPDGLLAPKPVSIETLRAFHCTPDPING
jgi:hypothetical protein